MQNLNVELIVTLWVYALVNKLDVQRILNSVGSKTDRKTYSLYISKRVMESFKRACKGNNPSRVVEHLIQKFVEASDIEQT
jgi:hypothetical protein